MLFEWVGQAFCQLDSPFDQSAFRLLAFVQGLLARRGNVFLGILPV